VDPRVVELEAQNAELRERVRVLEVQLAAVTGKIAELEKQKARNSSNSSKPPSSDPGPAKTDRPENANRAARRAMGRKQGKQPGTPGFTLSQVPDPDVVVTHSPAQCRGCDRSLDDAEVTGTSTRQVFDIPDPKVVVTEHRAEKRRCVCGCETVGVFPPEATAPACYGPGIKAHGVYLIAAQHLPRQRGALALHDLFGVTVSPGTLDNWIRDAADGLDGFVAAVTDLLRGAPVVHADETSVRSRKTALWVHVTCTRWLTLLHVGRRDKATVTAGPLGDYTGTIVHDRLAMYFNYGTAHVLCNAHILRSLNELLTNNHHKVWAKAFIKLIIDTKHHADTARTGGNDHLTPYRQRKIRARWDQLCEQAAAATPPPKPGLQLYGTNKDARLIANALTTHRDLFLAYTQDLTLPWDNNLAERDLRMVKLQAKISGEFRSPTGAARFATIRSYISTNRKQHQPIHQHLKNLFTPTGAWLPT
jgi:transposase